MKIVFTVMAQDFTEASCIQDFLEENQLAYEVTNINGKGAGPAKRKTGGRRIRFTEQQIADIEKLVKKGYGPKEIKKELKLPQRAHSVSSLKHRMGW